MNSILNKNLFLVKEHIGIFKASNNFDIFDPSSKEMLMTCREEELSVFTKLLRFTDVKRMTPFNLIIRNTNGEKVLRVKRGISIILSTVEVFDENDVLIGRFKQKFFSIGGKFDVLSAQDEVLCKLKGTWVSWDFSFDKNGMELAHVSKKWAGLGKELFTSADNYVLSVNELVPANSPIRQLIMGAVLCIDMVLKE